MEQSKSDRPGVSIAFCPSITGPSDRPSARGVWSVVGLRTGREGTGQLDAARGMKRSERGAVGVVAAT